MELEEAFAKLSEHTRDKCASCRVPHNCCSADQCRVVNDQALEMFGVDLQETDHPTLPFLGPNGCVVPPHLRPNCTVHVCGQHFGKDKAWDDEYWRLRELAGKALEAAYPL